MLIDQWVKGVASVRRAEAVEVWNEQVLARKRAMEPIKARLRSRGQAQTWLWSELNKERGISIALPLLYAYLNGHARIPQRVLTAACRIAGVSESDITRRIAVDVLLQATRGKKRTRAKKNAAC